MSPESAASASLLARLRREVAADRRAMAQHEEDAARLVAILGGSENATRANLAWAATSLHAWYTALESILERIARQLDANMPTGDRWHQQLLSQSMAEIPGVRPSILAEHLETDLLELLGFRHFFRHAYAVALDPTRLRRLLDQMASVAPAVGKDLDQIERFLAQGQAQLAAYES